MILEAGLDRTPRVHQRPPLCLRLGPERRESPSPKNFGDYTSRSVSYRTNSNDGGLS